jgi:hypothetical protein
VLARCSIVDTVNIGLILMRTSSPIALRKIDLLILLVGLAAFLTGAVLLLEIAISDEKAWSTSPITRTATALQP